MAIVNNWHYEFHEHPTLASRLAYGVALLALFFGLLAALPAHTARQAAIRGVSDNCDAPSCVGTRQVITAGHARLLKRELADHALIVDIRASAEPQTQLALVSDAHVPFTEAGGAGSGETNAQPQFRIDFAANVDDALRATAARHDDPVILVSPSPERSVLAALLLQERGYTRVFVAVE